MSKPKPEALEGEALEDSSIGARSGFESLSPLYLQENGGIILKGYMYILECSDGSYYTGSTTDLERRLAQHQAGEGANHTRKRLPVTLVYYEEYARIDEAFYREKQVQGWNRKKKEALINGQSEFLPRLALAYRDITGLREPQPSMSKPKLLKTAALA